MPVACSLQQSCNKQHHHTHCLPPRWPCLHVQEDRPAKKAKVFTGKGARLTDILPPPQNAEPTSAVLGLGAGQVCAGPAALLQLSTCSSWTSCHCSLSHEVFAGQPCITMSRLHQPGSGLQAGLLTCVDLPPLQQSHRRLAPAMVSCA